MNFNKIKEYCDQNGLNISDLAEKIGISKPGLYRSIQEKSMKVETLENISRVLNVPIWYFFDLDPEAPFLKEIEKHNNRLKINEETLEQMTKVIAELKGKQKNIKTVTLMFTFARELVAYGRIDKQRYEILIHLLLDFLESTQDDSARDTFMSSIEPLLPAKDKGDSKPVI